MDANEFECFRLTLQKYVAEKIPINASFHSCQILESTFLLGREKEIVRKAVLKRVNEFSAGRLCARKCLSFFGIEDFEILQGRFGEPLWPDGITGSITHHAGVAFAVCMPVDQGYIGIDVVDLTESLPDPAAVLTDIELGTHFEKNSRHPKLLLFSSKESVIKILSPLLQEYVEFKDIEIKFDGKGARVKFRAQYLNIDLSWLRHGRYAVTMAIMKN